MAIATKAQGFTADSTEVQLFLLAWHESGREAFARTYPNSYAIGAYDSENGSLKTAKDRGRRWIALDEGSSGRFLLDKATGEVYTIKAYGRPNQRIGTLETMTALYTR
jgi:hypothetical protein